MGLSIKQTSGIQRNLPAARSVSVAMNGPPPTFDQGIFLMKTETQVQDKLIKKSDVTSTFQTIVICFRKLRF